MVKATYGMKDNLAINSLREKVSRLIEDNRMLRAELKKADAERQKSVLQKRKAEEKSLELEKRLRKLETAGALGGQAGDTRAARQRINKLLREIDRCIALMNR